MKTCAADNPEMRDIIRATYFRLQLVDVTRALKSYAGVINFVSLVVAHLTYAWRI